MIVVTTYFHNYEHVWILLIKTIYVYIIIIIQYILIFFGFMFFILLFTMCTFMWLQTGDIKKHNVSWRVSRIQGIKISSRSWTTILYIWREIMKTCYNSQRMTQILYFWSLKCCIIVSRIPPKPINIEIKQSKCQYMFFQKIDFAVVLNNVRATCSFLWHFRTPLKVI